MLVFADNDTTCPRFTLDQIEAQLLAMPAESFGVSERHGATHEDGLKMCRVRVWDELRRGLMALAEHRTKEQ